MIDILHSGLIFFALIDIHEALFHIELLSSFCVEFKYVYNIRYVNIIPNCDDLLR